jgi:replication factor C subunit 1
VELNASDTRSATAIRDILDKASKSAAIGFSSSEKTRRVLILDEVDGMSSSDRGGVATLCRFLKAGTAFPIVCIANERTSPKLRGLAANCLDIRFSRPTKTTIAKTLLNGAVKKEGLTITQSELETLCEQNGNDIRAILNSLQFSGHGSGSKDEILRTDIFSATGKLFGRVGKTLDEKMGHVFLDASMIPLMVHEGYIQAADKSREPKDTALERCWKAADCLGTWDILDKRIRRTQAWGLLPSATLAVVHAAETVKGPAPFQIFPAWLGKFSKQQKHRRYVKELQQSMLSGEEGLIDSRDLLKAKLYDPSLSPSEVIHTLQDLQLTRDAMFEYLPELSFSDSQPVMDTKKKGTITREWNKLYTCKLEKEKKGTNEDDDLESVVSDVDEFIEE